MRLGELISPARVSRCGDRELPILSITKQDGIVLQSEKFKKKVASADASSYKVVPRGKLVQGIHIDEANFGIQDLVDEGIVSPAYKIWDVNEKLVLPEYLAAALRSECCIAYYRKNLSGTVHRRGRMSNEVFYALEINVPSLDEQLNSMRALDEVLTEQKAFSAQLNKLDELVKSRFVEMFGDPGINERDLPTDKLANLGTLERGKSKHRPRNAPELRGGPDGPYPLVQTGDVTNAGLYLTEYSDTYTELGLQQSKMWDKGTLCITIAANIAQTSILAFDACFPDSVVGFIPGKRVTNVFLHYWFGFFQGILEAQAPQAAQKNINLKILSGLDVIVPPMAEQEKFISFVQQVDKLKFA